MRFMLANIAFGIPRGGTLMIGAGIVVTLEGAATLLFGARADGGPFIFAVGTLILVAGPALAAAGGYFNGREGTTTRTKPSRLPRGWPFIF